MNFPRQQLKRNVSERMNAGKRLRNGCQPKQRLHGSSNGFTGYYTKSQTDVTRCPPYPTRAARADNMVDIPVFQRTASAEGIRCRSWEVEDFSEVSYDDHLSVAVTGTVPSGRSAAGWTTAGECDVCGGVLLGR